MTSIEKSFQNVLSELKNCVFICDCGHVIFVNKAEGEMLTGLCIQCSSDLHEEFLKENEEDE